MSRIRRIHHINFLFRDLTAAVARFESLGLGPFVYEDLAERGVQTARAELGESWLVLVSPTRTDGIPAQHLAEHGEGFFLLSFGVDDLDEAMVRLESGDGIQAEPPRSGIANWCIADLPVEQTLGIRLQLATDRD